MNSFWFGGNEGYNGGDNQSDNLKSLMDKRLEQIQSSSKSKSDCEGEEERVTSSIHVIVWSVLTVRRELQIVD